MPPSATEGPRAHRFQTCLTTQEVFSQHRAAYPSLTYHRIPVPDFCAPREEVRGPGRPALWGGAEAPLTSPLAWASAVGLAQGGEDHPDCSEGRMGSFFYKVSDLGVYPHSLRAWCVYIGVYYVW